jgi:DNA-binding transcriptional LysR family regulator
MNFKHLQTFVTICEGGTVSRAAAQLGITQPALSRRIKALQEELGLRLFDNLGRRLSLTSEGEEFLRHSRALLAQAEACLPPAAPLAAAEPASCESEELRTRLLPSSRPL